MAVIIFFIILIIVSGMVALITNVKIVVEGAQFIVMIISVVVLWEVVLKF